MVGELSFLYIQFCLQGTSSGKHLWLDGCLFFSYTTLRGLCQVVFECYVLYALIVLVQAEIFDKHFMVVLATLNTKLKGEQLPQIIKD